MKDVENPILRNALAGRTGKILLQAPCSECVTATELQRFLWSFNVWYKLASQSWVCAEFSLHNHCHITSLIHLYVLMLPFLRTASVVSEFFFYVDWMSGLCPLSTILNRTLENKEWNNQNWKINQQITMKWCGHVSCPKYSFMHEDNKNIKMGVTGYKRCCHTVQGNNVRECRTTEAWFVVGNLQEKRSEVCSPVSFDWLEIAWFMLLVITVHLMLTDHTKMVMI